MTRASGLPPSDTRLVICLLVQMALRPSSPSLRLGGSQPPNEVMEMIRRLQVPNHEWACLSFPAAIAEVVFEPRSALGHYDQRKIFALCK